MRGVLAHLRSARERALRGERACRTKTSSQTGLHLLEQLEMDARSLLLRSIELLSSSLRAYTKVLRVARTIADLGGSDVVRSSHVAEAIQYRLLDRDLHATRPRAEAPSAPESSVGPNGAAHVAPLEPNV